MEKKIAVLPGDGIGPEIVASAVRVLQAIGKRYKHDFQLAYAAIGGAAIDQFNDPLPEETIQTCKESDAILLGAVGGPKWDNNPADLRPEKGLLRIRKTFDLFANLRPVKAFPNLLDSSPLKREVAENVDLLIVRELTGGIYFGRPSERLEKDGQEAVVDTLFYTKEEMVRVIRLAFELARNRRKKVTSVDKANVLESSRMWRETAEEIAKDYPDVELNHMLVDNAAMQLIRYPKQFDVIVTENMFGDILSDEASMLTGSLGMLPSASLSENGPYLYEPIHGSAPDIAGRNIANPLATILSAAMLLRLSFGLEKEAMAVEQAVHTVLNQGYRTKDIAAEGQDYLTTTEMVEKVKEAVLQTETVS